MEPKPHNGLKIRALIDEGEYALAAGPHPARARLDAETLLLHILRRSEPGRNRAWLIAHSNSAVRPPVKAECEAWIARRSLGEPIQYITGETEFFGLPFSVGPGVLIPRPETEHLVEEAIRLAAQFPDPAVRIADIGTGSGAIAVALAHSLPDTQITATDISPPALALARANAERNQVAERIEFLEGDLLTPLAGRTFSMIASNPPYIPLRDKPSLSIEVRDHEPHSALFAGDDGLAIYRRLIPGASAHLVPGGWIVLEIGYGQRPAMETMLEASGYTDIYFLDDYQAIPRVAIGQRP